MDRLRKVFEANASKPQSPVDFELARTSIARHNLKYAAQRARRSSQVRTRPSADREAAPRSSFVQLGESAGLYLPQLDQAILADRDDQVFKAVLSSFFEEHDPKRVGEVDSLLEENLGREDVLFMELSSKYPEPNVDVAFGLFYSMEKDKTTANDGEWAVFDDDDQPIVNAARRPSGVWNVNYSPWGDV